MKSKFRNQGELPCVRFEYIELYLSLFVIHISFNIKLACPTVLKGLIILIRTPYVSSLENGVKMDVHGNQKRGIYTILRF